VASGKDTFHARKPQGNEALFASEKQLATKRAGRGATALPIARRDMSAQVLRLAKRLGKDPEKLAEEIPPETLRRTKYPVIEEAQPDGSRLYKRDLGIVDNAVKPLLHK
jgi:hypothetical protein